MKKLYIIGNGFDIHHHIPSSYNDFAEWLIANDEDTYEKVEEIIGDYNPTWWNEFETNLGNPFGIKLFTENVAFENQPNYASDDYRDRDLYDAEFEIERELGGLIDSLRDDFQQWASALPMPMGVGDFAIRIDTADSVFLTFNYSLTLEKIYGVKLENVLHIHGSALDKKSIIVGHGRDYSSFRDELDEDLPDPPDDLPTKDYERWFDDVASQYADDYPTMRAKDAAASAMTVMWKNVQGNIVRNQQFFKSLRGVESIHIYGFSFADVDMPYIMEVVNNVDIKNVKLEISYFSDKDKMKIEKFLKIIHKPQLVSLIELKDLMRHKQQKLF